MLWMKLKHTFPHSFNSRAVYQLPGPVVKIGAAFTFSQPVECRVDYLTAHHVITHSLELAHGDDAQQAQD